MGRLHGKLRNELLNGELACMVTEARVLFERSREHYDHARPHSAHECRHRQRRKSLLERLPPRSWPYRSGFRIGRKLLTLISDIGTHFHLFDRQLVPFALTTPGSPMNPQQPYTGFSTDFTTESIFPDNPDPRAPCVLVMDTSGSMGGQPIAALNEGLRLYREALVQDPLAARRVEVSIVTFGGTVQVAQPFVEVSQFSPPHLSADGDTPMATAVARAMVELEGRKHTYRASGIHFYRPWIFLFTDGAPTESEEKWQVACEAVRRGEQEKKFTFYAVGVEGADFAKLGQLSPGRPPLRLNGIAFREFFKWLSASQRSVSQSQPGQTIQLPPVTGPDGWAAAVV